MLNTSQTLSHCQRCLEWCSLKRDEISRSDISFVLLGKWWERCSIRGDVLKQNSVMGILIISSGGLFHHDSINRNCWWNRTMTCEVRRRGYLPECTWFVGRNGRGRGNWGDAAQLGLSPSIKTPTPASFLPLSVTWLRGAAALEWFHNTGKRY